MCIFSCKCSGVSLGRGKSPPARLSRQGGKPLGFNTPLPPLQWPVLANLNELIRHAEAPYAQHRRLVRRIGLWPIAELLYKKAPYAQHRRLVRRIGLWPIAEQIY